ncbi:MAG: YidC/Oxa1 family membrane protein insertase [Lachnospiraceae bacterium]|nr:YidC/Oxa1 family membrane protein insertase [Lachnospiraceae bacterium]
MTGMLLTQSDTFIIGPVATLLGYVMNAIFMLLEKVGLPSIGLAIIIFTIVVNLCMLPLTIKQQKFSKLSAKMNPELQAIQKKYKDRRDNDSMMKMNEETQAVYKKYGVSPSGSCVQLLIQFPILLALYQVIYNFPAYVTSVKNTFMVVVDKLMPLEGASEFLQTFKNAMTYSSQFKSEEFVAGSEFMKNTFIDVLNKASTAEWMSLKTEFPSIADSVQSTYNALSEYNNFLGLNIANSPSYIVSDAFKAGSYGLVIGALMIPILAALTQYLNVKLMPQQENKGGSGSETADAMMQSMKTMNMTMPIMSAIFCFTLPTGMGIYWIAGSVVRSIQQVIVNRHIDKIDFDEVVRKNMEKAEEDRKKNKNNVAASTVNSAAHTSTKNISSRSNMSQMEKEELIEKARNASAKKGSLAAKANMVRDYNERNTK